MLLDGSPILMHTVRKFAASDRVARNRGGRARRRYSIGWREMLARANSPTAACAWWRAATAARNRWRTPCARSARTPTWSRCTTPCARSSTWRPFTRSSTRPPRPAPPSWASPAVDTVKQVSRGTGHVRIRATLPREKLVLAQTPQVFRHDLLVPRVRSGARRWLHRHRRIQPGGAPGRGGAAW